MKTPLKKGIGSYAKKSKGNRGYKMSGPSLLKMVADSKPSPITVENVENVERVHGALEKPNGCRTLSPVPSAQETNLAQVGGTQDDPAEVSPGEVLGYVAQGFDIFSSVLGPIVASQSGELQGGTLAATPQAAGVMAVTSPNQPGSEAVVVATLEVPWVPIGIGAALLVGLVAIVVLR